MPLDARRPTLTVPGASSRATGLIPDPGGMEFSGTPLLSAGSAPATPASGTDRAAAATTVANTFLIISSPLDDYWSLVNSNWRPMTIRTLSHARYVSANANGRLPAFDGKRSWLA